jgi:hypothetical protein
MYNIIVEYNILILFDPSLKTCSIQKQTCGMINTPLNEGCAGEKVTIGRREDCLCQQAG